MSTTQERQDKQPQNVFEREIVEDRNVCDNCYRPTHETAHPWSSHAPDRIRIRREDTTEVEGPGMFCECGAAPGAQIRPRDLGTFLDHARNASRTLSARGYDVDVGVVVEVAEDLKTTEETTGQEELILAHAVEIALGD